MELFSKSVFWIALGDDIAGTAVGTLILDDEPHERPGERDEKEVKSEKGARIVTGTGTEFVFNAGTRSELHSGDNCVRWEAVTCVDCEINEQSFCKTFTRSGFIRGVGVEVDAGVGAGLTKSTILDETEPHGVLDKSPNELDGEGTAYGFETRSGTLFTTIGVGAEPHGRMDDDGQGGDTIFGFENWSATEGEVGETVDDAGWANGVALVGEDDKSFTKICTRDW